MAGVLSAAVGGSSTGSLARHQSLASVRQCRLPARQHPSAPAGRARLSPPAWRSICVAAAGSAVAEDSAPLESAPMVMGELDEIADADSRAFAVACAKVADDTKAQDVLVLHVAPLVSWCSYMVFSTVVSKPQLLAVMARTEQAAEAEWDRSTQNSPGSSPWEVQDFGDVVVHVMTPEQRELYDLESFYAAAEEVDLPFLEQQGGGSTWSTSI